MLPGAEFDPLPRLDLGAGKRGVLLLHGFTGSGRAWGDHILRALSIDRRVIAADLPGHGATPSDPSPEPAEGRWNRLIDRIAATLDAAETGKVDLVGYSMGGRIALAFALRHPERVRRLVLESASPGIDDPGLREERRRWDEQIASELEAGGIAGFVERWMALPLFHTQSALPAGVRERERSRRLESDPVGLARALRDYGTGVQPSLWDQLSELEPPALLLTGELDPAYVKLADRMAHEIPGAVHRTIAGAGHAVHLEAPEPWLAAVKGFLGGDVPVDTGGRAGPR